MKRLVLLVLVCLVGVNGFAGQLNPSGPPSSSGTMKTLDEVKAGTPIPGSTTYGGQFAISEPGYYYLTGNRKVDYYGIMVYADNVVIDLNGFTLEGDADAPYGIYMSGRKNVTVKNGTIISFKNPVYMSSSDGGGAGWKISP